MLTCILTYIVGCQQRRTLDNNVYLICVLVIHANTIVESMRNEVNLSSDLKFNDFNVKSIGTSPKITLTGPFQRLTKEEASPAAHLVITTHSDCRVSYLEQYNRRRVLPFHHQRFYLRLKKNAEIIDLYMHEAIERLLPVVWKSNLSLLWLEWSDSSCRYLTKAEDKVKWKSTSNVWEQLLHFSFNLKKKSHGNSTCCGETHSYRNVVNVNPYEQPLQSHHHQFCCIISAKTLPLSMNGQIRWLKSAMHHAREAEWNIKTFKGMHFLMKNLHNPSWVMDTLGKALLLCYWPQVVAGCNISRKISKRFFSLRWISE